MNIVVIVVVICCRHEVWMDFRLVGPASTPMVIYYFVDLAYQFQFYLPLQVTTNLQSSVVKLFIP